MNVKIIVTRILESRSGIAKTADFFREGISPNDLLRLRRNGFIEQIRHGYYTLPGDETASEEQMLSSLIPQGIICVESALFHYGYSDFTPRKWSIAVPRSITRKKLEIATLPLHTYFVQEELYTIGKTSDVFAGVTLPVYDRERTICDCFKYRSKLDSEIFNKAIHGYIADEQKNLYNLVEYAKKLRVYTQLMNLMEVLLND